MALHGFPGARQLLEDAPAIGVKVQDLNTTVSKPVQEMRYGTLTENVPVPEKPLWKQFEMEQARKKGEEYDDTYDGSSIPASFR